MKKIVAIFSFFHNTISTLKFVFHIPCTVNCAFTNLQGQFVIRFSYKLHDFKINLDWGAQNFNIFLMSTYILMLSTIHAKIVHQRR